MNEGNPELLVIVGTGLFAEVAKVYFEELANYRVDAFACHARYREADTIHGLPLHKLEELEALCPPEQYKVFVAIGYGKMNKHRQSVYEEMVARGYRLATFVHPGVKIWSSTTLGDNVFIFEDNTVQPFTDIGSNTILWSGNHIGHHSRVGDHCFISSHVVISGSCEIGKNTFIGVNATLRDGLKIGDETLIGGGAIIMHDTDPKSVYVPERTKVHKKNSEEIGF